MRVVRERYRRRALRRGDFGEHSGAARCSASGQASGACLFRLLTEEGPRFARLERLRGPDTAAPYFARSARAVRHTALLVGTSLDSPRYRPPAPPVPPPASASRNDDATPYAAWCERLRGGDGAAFTELFDDLHPALLRYAWRLLRDEDAAQDVVQDAFLRLWRRRATLDPTRSIRSLMYTTVHNRSLNWIRDRKLHAQPDDEIALRAWDTTPDASARLDADRLQDRLDGWIARLPDRRREAFVLSRYQGLTHAEIAEVMGLTPRTVNTHIVLALRDLRERLRTLSPEDPAFQL